MFAHPSCIDKIGSIPLTPDLLSGSNKLKTRQQAREPSTYHFETGCTIESSSAIGDLPPHMIANIFVVTGR